jgi:hypothetical protein
MSSSIVPPFVAHGAGVPELSGRVVEDMVQQPVRLPGQHEPLLLDLAPLAALLDQVQRPAWSVVAVASGDIP